MSGAAAFWCPTIYFEPFGLIAIEAQCCGTPVICTDRGGFTETVLHGVTGYRCHTKTDAETAVANLGKIDPHVCRQWVMGNFTTDRAAEKYDEYFRKIATDPDAPCDLGWLSRTYPSPQENCDLALDLVGAVR
jgi:glycosyltransferase involved in cell wall biosynthesis